MKKVTFRRVWAYFLTFVMVLGMIPTTALAAVGSHVNSTGQPTAVDGDLLISIFNGTSFPGEPAVNNPSSYKGLNTSFGTSGGDTTFEAATRINSNILSDVQRGPNSSGWSGTIRVWGVESTQLDKYFTQAFQEELAANEEKIIKAIKGSGADASQYDVIWYVLKFQDDSGWHLDGLIQEAESYSVNYYGNGGTGAPSGPKDLKMNETYTLASGSGLSRSGYTFSHWNTAADGSGTSYSAGQTISITGNLSLYAQWTAKEYTVTYDANGGSGAPAAQTKLHGVGLTLSSDTPTRDNHAFLGWGTSRYNNTVNYQPGDTYTGNQNITLYAKWQSNPGTLVVEKTFVGISTAPAEFQIQVSGPNGYSKVLTIADVSSVGGMTYTWNLGLVAVGNYSVTESGGALPGYTFISDESTTYAAPKVTAGGTATAQLRNVYAANTYTVTWLAEDGSTEIRKDTGVPYGTVYGSGSYLVPVAPGVSNKIFTGWTPAVVPVTKDATYTATYADAVTVTYKDGADGAVFADQSYTVATGSATPGFVGSLNRPGYTFNGWDPTPGTTVSTNSEFTAQWTASSDTAYTVRHYKMVNNTTDGAVLVDADTEHKTGTTGATVTAAAKSYPGYQLFGSLPSGTVKADGSLVLNVYYIPVYTVTWVAYDSSTQTTEKVYGTVVSTLTPPTLSGYEDQDYTYTHKTGWDGWKQIIPAAAQTTVTQDMTFEAVYQAVAKPRLATVKVYLNDTYTDGVGHANAEANLTSLDSMIGIVGKGKIYVQPVGGGTTTELIGNSHGTYTATLPVGEYHIYLSADGGATKHLETDRVLDVEVGGSNTVNIYFYSVTYDLQGGTDGPNPLVEYYRHNTKVYVSKQTPTKSGKIFTGWKIKPDGSGKTYAPSTDSLPAVLVENIHEPYTLYAQWVDAQQVQVTVKVNHVAAGGGPANVPNAGDSLTVDLTHQSGSNYIDVPGKKSIVEKSDWYGTPVGNVSTYILEPFTNLDPSGSYSARATLNGYKIVGTPSVTTEGNLTKITLELQYDPKGFDLTFDVEFEYDGVDLSTMDARLIPTAVDAKVYHSKDGVNWTLIGEHQTGAEEVVDTDSDASKWSGTGQVHVYGIDTSDSNSTYYYKVEVFSIDVNGFTMPVADGSSALYEIYPAGAYTVTSDFSRLVDSKGIYGDEGVQRGEVKLTVTVHPYQLKLDPNGGKFGSSTAAKMVADRFTVPALAVAEYTPVKDGYEFKGWYTENGAGGNWGTQVSGGKKLRELTGTLGGTVTLYAKWIPKRTISGNVSLATFYMQGSDKIYINDYDLPESILVKAVNVGSGNTVATATISSISYDDVGGNRKDNATVHYAISGLPNDGSEYRIVIEVPNYTTEYTPNTGNAVFTDEQDDEAVVDARLKFEPESFNLLYTVDASAIAKDFRESIGSDSKPNFVGIVVQYDDSSTSVVNNWPIITQQDDGTEVTPVYPVFGADGKDTDESVSVWSNHTSGFKYNYAVKVYNYNSTVNGQSVSAAFGTGAPFTVTYGNPVYIQEGDTEKLSVTLTPREYVITYDLDGGALEGTNPANYRWSHGADITEVPTKTGYEFAGWEASVDGVYADGKIVPSAAADVKLTARWTQLKKVTFKIVGGTWQGGGSDDQVVYVKVGDAIPYPADMDPISGYYKTPGSWDSSDVNAIDVTDATYTYTFTRSTVTVSYKVANTGIKNVSEMYQDASDTLYYGEQIKVDPNGGVWNYKGTDYDTTETLTLKEDTPLANPTRGGYVFLGWTKTAGTDPIVNVYTANWDRDVQNEENPTASSGDGIPDTYQKTVIYEIVGGYWSGSDDGNKLEVVTLKNSAGEWDAFGSAELTGVETGSADAKIGFIKDPAPVWSPKNPGGITVTGTNTETYIYSFYTKVIYDEVRSGEVTPAAGVIAEILPGKYIGIDPNGGTWDGKTEQSYQQINEAYNLAQPTRADYVFLGWEKTTSAYAELPYVFTAQWMHVSELKYPVTVTTLLDGVPASVSALHAGATGFEIESATDPTLKYPLTETSAGVYTGEAKSGTYYIYRLGSGGSREKVGNYQLNVTTTGGSQTVKHYSVTYDTAGGDPTPSKEIYYEGLPVTVSDTKPTLTGYDFKGWKSSVDGTVYPASAALTGAAGIVQTYVLTAQWEKQVNVKVNVTVDYKDSTDVVDPSGTRDKVTFQLMNGGVKVGVPMTLTEDTSSTHTATVVKDGSSPVGIDYTDNGNTYTNLSAGDYTVSVAKSGYKVVSVTKETHGDTQIITVNLKYDPDRFDLTFNVEMDPSVPEQLWPAAVDVKIAFLNTGTGKWELIPSHVGTAAPISVTIGEGGKGSGSYPVSKHISGTDPLQAYDYRVVVTKFVYESGVAKPANVTEADVKYSDGNFVATVSIKNGGRSAGGLTGAYYAGSQDGTPTVTVDVAKYDVIFKANGGSWIGDKNQETVPDQYTVPAFPVTAPARDSYKFLGWYTKDGTHGDWGEAAVAGTPLVKETTLYAKWEPIQTIHGDITVVGTYEQGGSTIEVNDVDRAKEVTVVLQRKIGSSVYDLETVTKTVSWTGSAGTVTYTFANLAALPEGQSYQVTVSAINYTAAYKNEKGQSSNTAVFETNPTQTYVDATLTFTPESYDQEVKVDATAIGDEFRPETVRAQIWYWEQGTANPFALITQHTTDPFGLIIPDADADGMGEGSQSVWKWNWTEHPYDYRAKAVEVISSSKYSLTGSDVESNFYFTVTYGPDANWNGSGASALTITLMPKTYTVTYDMNTSEVANKTTEHTWSHETGLTLKPERTGYVFMGWYSDPACADPAVTSVSADVCQDTTVYAKWESDVLTDPTDDKNGGDPGDGIPDIYQCVVTFNIVGGTWGVGGGSAPIDRVYSLKTKDGSDNWTDASPTLGSRIPSNMTPSDGHWTPVAIDADTPVTGNAAYTYTYQYSISYDLNGGTSTQSAGYYDPATVLYGTEITVKDAPERDGYIFHGWQTAGGTAYQPGSSITMTEKQTLTAQWTPDYKDVTYPDADKDTNKDGKPDDVTVKVQKTKSILVKPNGGKWNGSKADQTVTITDGYTLAPDPARDGYIFEGWERTDGTGDVIYIFTAQWSAVVLPSVTPAPTVSVKGLNTIDHVAYVVGYGKNDFRPMGNITRAEVATVYFRLMTEEFRAQFWSNENSFSDVANTAWYNVAISTLENAGVIKDTITGGKFRPDDPITRAELAVMAAQFAKVTGKIPVTSFKDVNKDHWAADEIALVESAGWIEGYMGYYRPEDNLTRAEFVTIVNRMLKRNVEAENMLDNMVTFVDNIYGAWYYEAVQEAANTHTYTRTDKRVPEQGYNYEKWVDLLPSPDWAALEKAWFTANSK